MMPQYLQRRWKALVPVAVAATGVIAYQSYAHAATRATAPVFSATQLADGVMFDNGPAAPYLVSLNRPVPPSSSQLTAIENATNSAISANSSLAASLATELQSGNPSQVQNALSQLGSVTLSVLDGLFGSTAVTQAAANLNNEINEGQILQGIGMGDELDDYYMTWTNTSKALNNETTIDNQGIGDLYFPLNATGEAVSTLNLAGQLIIGSIATHLYA